MRQCTLIEVDSRIDVDSTNSVQLDSYFRVRETTETELSVATHRLHLAQTYQSFIGFYLG